MKSLLLVAALLSSTASAAFAELQFSPGLPDGLILGADGQLYFDPNAGKLRAVPGTVIGPDAAGRFLNPRAPGGPQRVGRALTNTDQPLAVLALPFTGAGTLVDIANPFSGDGFGSRGTVGRGFAGKTTAAPGRWLTDGAKGTATWLGVAGGAVTALGGALGQAGVAAAGGELISAGAGIAAAGDLVAGLDYVNPFSGDGFGSQGNVGRGIAATPQVVPGRYLDHKADDYEFLRPLASLPIFLDQLNPWSGEGFTNAGAVGRALRRNDLYSALDYINPLSGNGVGSYGDVGNPNTSGRYLSDLTDDYEFLLPLAAFPGIIDTANPFSGGGFGSYGSVGRSLQVYGPGGVPVHLGNGTALANTGRLGAMLTWPVSTIDYLNPLSGGGYAEEGSVGRSVELAGHVGLEVAGAALGVETAGIAVPVVAGLALADWLNPWSGDGVGSEGGIVGRGIAPRATGRFLGNTLNSTGGIALDVGAAAGAAAAPVAAGAVAVGALADLLNPWSGAGVGDFGGYGRGLGVPGGVAGQVPYYSTGNTVMAPVQYDVGPQGTTISITIPNSYNIGQMGMTPMVPAMSAPQYRVIPQYAAPVPVAYAAPAPVAYAAPATSANAAVAPVAANAGVKCQVGDQQAVALTVDACEEAGGLVQPMDAPQAAE